MGHFNLAAIIAAIPTILKAGKDMGLDKKYGIIHKRKEAEIDGKHGFLVWDYLLYNEITFQYDSGEIKSFCSKFSDKETEQAWEELVKQYGV